MTFTIAWSKSFWNKAKPKQSRLNLDTRLKKIALITDWNYTPHHVTFNCLYGETLSPVTVIFDRLLLLSSNYLVFYVFSQMSTNVPVNCMTVTSMPTATIPSVPIDAPAIPGTRETEQAAIFVSLSNIEIQVTSVCYDTRISHSLSFCIVIWSLQFWKHIFLTWVGPESRPRWNSS